jgi:hypothetical protein
MKRTSRIALGLTAAVFAAVGFGSAPATAAGPNSFTLHLTCDNGKSYDIFVNDSHSVAALVEGSSVVAVLKNGNGTVVPAFADGGPRAGTLVTCDTGIPGFTALVLFTPASQR